MIPQSSRRGLTLIEILVVVCVLGTLASIIVPALIRSKQAAKRQVCSTALSQWGRALELYTADQSDVLPRRGPRRVSMPFDWAIELGRYLGGASNGRCPAVSEDAFRHFAIDYQTKARPYTGFAFNQFITDGFVQQPPEPNVIALTEVVAFNRSQGNTVTNYFFSELTTLDFLAYEFACSIRTPKSREPCGRQNWGALRHLGGSNALFLDGRTKWFRPSQFRLARLTAPGQFQYYGPIDGPRFHPKEP